MRTIYLGILLLFVLNCKSKLDSKKKSENQNCDVDIEFISNYLNDISRVIAIQKSVDDYAIDSFRRLEGLTRNEYDYDYLGHYYSEEMTDLNILTQKITVWLEWMEDNKCSFTIEMANDIFKRADSSMISSVLNEDEYINKLKIKNPKYQVLTDSMIIEVEKLKLESGRLGFYPVSDSLLKLK